MLFLSNSRWSVPESPLWFSKFSTSQVEGGAVAAAVALGLGALAPSAPDGAPHAAVSPEHAQIKTSAERIKDLIEFTSAKGRRD